MKNNINLLIIVLAVAGLFLNVCQTTPHDDFDEPEEIIRTPSDFEPEPKPVIVAVIDTGFDTSSNWSSILKHYKNLRKPRLCKYGHMDFTGYGLSDNHGHGTHIASTIAANAGDANYCLVILKFFDSTKNVTDSQFDTLLAFQRAIDLKVNIINYSGGGLERSKEECDVIKKALNAGITIIAAAGNESSDINKTPYYPAMCDSRIKVVANVTANGEYHPRSNYTTDRPSSRFLYKELGYNVLALMPNNTVGFMSGTSQATAVLTGKTIKNWKKP